MNAFWIARHVLTVIIVVIFETMLRRGDASDGKYNRNIAIHVGYVFTR